MPSGLLGVVGIILGYAGIALTLIGIAWATHAQGRALANPNQQARIGRQLQSASWVWFAAGAVFLFLAVYLSLKL